jgi:predicted metal-binding membrane protein
MSLQRERTFILALLLILAAASWAVLIWQSRTANGMGMGMGAALFLAIWVVMMIAMMFPAAAPMILVFAQVQRDRRRGGWAFVPTWIFAGTYLLIWTLFGGLSYLGANVSGVLAQQLPWLMMNASRIIGGIVVLAGLYQLTSLKRVCLAKCCNLWISSSIPGVMVTLVLFAWAWSTVSTAWSVTGCSSCCSSLWA